VEVKSALSGNGCAGPFFAGLQMKKPRKALPSVVFVFRNSVSSKLGRNF